MHKKKPLTSTALAALLIASLPSGSGLAKSLPLVVAVEEPQAEEPASRRRGRGRLNIGLPSILPDGRFSVTGRDGPYMSTLDPSQLDSRATSMQTRSLAFEGDNIQTANGIRFRMPETEARLISLLGDLDKNWPYQRHTPYRIIISLEGSYAPSVRPDGTIILPFNMLKTVDTDDELAYGLAHELSHIRLSHFSDDSAYRAKRRAVNGIRDIYSLSVILGELDMTGSGDSMSFVIKNKNRVRDGMERASKISNDLNFLSSLLLEPIWSRNQEDQADALAFDMVAQNQMAAIEGSSVLFTKLNRGVQLEEELSSDIVDSLRIGADMGAREIKNNGLSSREGWKERVLNPLQRILLNRSLDAAKRYLHQRHRDPEKRSEGISEYGARAHPQLPPIDGGTDLLSAIRSSAEYQDALSVKDLVAEAAQLQSAGNIDAAIAAMTRAQRSRRFGDKAVVHNVLARLHAAKEDVGAADRHYNRAHADPDQVLSAYSEHAWLLVRHKRYAVAKTVIDNGRERARATIQSSVEAAGVEAIDVAKAARKPFLISMVALAMQQRKDQEAFGYLNECLSYEEEALGNECIHAALGTRLKDRNRELTDDELLLIDAAVTQAKREGSLGSRMLDIIKGLGGD